MMLQPLSQNTITLIRPRVDNFTGIKIIRFKYCYLPKIMEFINGAIIFIHNAVSFFSRLKVFF